MTSSLAATRRRPLDERREVRADRREVEPLLARKIGNAEATAEVQEAHRRRRVLRQPQRQFVGLALRLADRLGLQVLRAGKEVKALEGQARLPISASSLRHLLGVDAELLRPAAHLHARRLELEVRIHAHRHARGQAKLSCDLRQQPDLAHRLDIDQDARRDRLHAVRPRALPGPAKLISCGSAPASSATFSSPPDATSMPSTRPAMCATSAGIGLAFIA